MLWHDTKFTILNENFSYFFYVSKGILIILFRSRFSHFDRISGGPVTLFKIVRYHFDVNLVFSIRIRGRNLCLIHEIRRYQRIAHASTISFAFFLRVTSHLPRRNACVVPINNRFHIPHATMTYFHSVSVEDLVQVVSCREIFLYW